MNRRLIIFIVVGLIILLGLGGALYYLSKKQSEPVVVKPQIKQILDESVISPAPSFDNSSVWYFNSEGRLFSVKTDGSGLSEYPLPSLSTGSLKRVLWPKTGTDFIAIAGNSGLETKSFY